jgi:hypothetical protein
MTNWLGSGRVGTGSSVICRNLLPHKVMVSVLPQINKKGGGRGNKRAMWDYFFLSLEAVSPMLCFFLF